jgi:hypothetical protein
MISETIKYQKALFTGIVLLSIFISPAVPILAQDDHYWSQQYGAVSTLLGGAMVGGVSDNSAVYYNPGALAFISNPNLSVDANVYRMDKILISDGAGNGMNLNSAQISIYPQIITGMLKLSKNERFKFSYTLLTRNHSNVLMNTRYTSSDPAMNADNQNPAANSFVGAFDYINQLTEQWLGIGAGYKVSDNVGIGATLFGSYRGQSYQLTNYVREINYLDSYYVFGTMTNDEAVKYTSIGLLAKFGLSCLSGKWKYGLTITTPSLRLYGSGSVQRENSNIVVSEFPEDMTKNFMIMDQVSDSRSTYKHPLSIAFGVEYHSEKTRLAISAEYFSGFDPYYMLKPDSKPFVYPPGYLDSAYVRTMIDSYLHIENASKPVLNAAIGFSQVVYKEFTLLLGASTDFSSYEKPSTSNDLMHGFSGWNIYHFSTGISYHRTKHDITLGLAYALTPSKNIPPYTIINQSPEITNNALMSAKSYSIVLGYTYYFTRTE